MKILIFTCVSWIIFILGIVPHENSQNNIPGVDTTLISEPIKLPFQLPNGFKLDSFKYYDKKRNTQVVIAIPTTDIKILNDKITADLLSQKENFIKSIDEIMKQDGDKYTSAMTSEFVAQPISIYKDKQIISYCFYVSYYHAGAPHPMDMYYSFNFDSNKQRKIDFSNYFLTKSKSDTIYFTELITKTINREGISLDTIKNLDFNIEQDTISFNFDDYEIGSYSEGMIRARIEKTKLVSKINKIYR